MYHSQVKAWACYFLSLASATTLQSLDRRQSSGSACAAISTAWLNAPSDQPFAAPGQDAYNCLTSMPFHPRLSAEFLNMTLRYVQFQSTLEILKNPPDTYQSAPFDIIGGLDEVASKIADNAFASHYDFELAINNVFRSANDGHFSMAGLCSIAIFDFSRPAQLLSISSDGTSEPQVYLLSDAILLQNNSAVSPVSTVDGQPVVDYLVNLSSRLPDQDPDARYKFSEAHINSLNFPNYGTTAARQRQELVPGNFKDGFAGYPGASVMIAFQNGSTISLATVASINTKSFNVTDGESMFEQFCLNTSPSSSGNSKVADSVKAVAAAPTFTAGPLGYPKPYLHDPYNEIIGWSLDGDYSDTVVMYVPTFEGDSEADNASAVVHEYSADFVKAAIKAGKTKIIIDVSGNPGGKITRGFDLFKLFFPGSFPYTATRFRNHAAVDIFGKVASNLSKTAAGAIADQTGLAYAGDVTPDQKRGFPNMAAVFDGGIEHGVNVSNLIANFNFTHNALANPDSGLIRGYAGVPETFDAPPFRPEDILIVGDGDCSSTCTTFVNLMVNVGGVKSLAFGGRPNGKPMQVMGGVRGGQSVAFSDIDLVSGLAAQAIEAHPKLFTPEEIRLAQETIPLGVQNLPFKIRSAGVNFRNAYQEGQPHLPLQFDYQPANCRLYYTLENILSPATTWVSAYDAVWGNGTCVGGLQETSPLRSGPSSTPSPSPSQGPSGASGTATATAAIGTYTAASTRNRVRWSVGLGVMGVVLLSNL